MTIKRAYGYIPDLPDARDHICYVSHPAMGLPPSVDLRPDMPPVYDQGELGSCTGNAIAGALQHARMAQGIASAKAEIPSRLFIYYYERVLENSVASDSGAQIRDGVKVVNKRGACFEDLWPYNIARFATAPGPNAVAAASKHEAVQYSRLDQSENAMKASLAAKMPFVIGFTVYESFESARVARTGTVPMPTAHERSVGGHAVLVVGYDDAAKRFMVRNSWGKTWGKMGYFTIPYAYFINSNLAQDIWNIKLVSA